ncbi:hypothetical protein [Lysobacter sp. A03]|uniref:hypothetical protein n=1 Tax=Lysobacter sp. A03 TaxID=1199154 RepID=UPI0005C60B9D|nr:hypothetical protein [Lysobacter sp. A03]
MNPTLSRPRPFWLCAILVTLVALVYWPGLSGPFLFDDFPTLVDNARLHTTSLAPDAIWKAAFSFDPGGGSRPLSMGSFAINHAISGLNPWAYKLTGLAVHLLNALLVALLCLQVLPMAGVAERHAPWAALSIALVWAVHPLQISTVLYVVQRMETLSLTFVLLALNSYLIGRRRQADGHRGWPWLVACLPLAALGLASKETAVLLPAYTLALELTVLSFAALRPATRQGWRWTYAAGTVAALLLFVFWAIPHYATIDAYAIRDFNAPERVLSQLRILPMYLGQILLPLPGTMLFYYDDYTASTSLRAPISTLMGGLLLLALLASAWLLRRKAPLFALGVFWFLFAHTLTSNVIALELVFEHRNYFALLGVLLAIAELVRLLPVRDGPAIKYAGVAVLILGIGALGMLRSATWGERLLLSTDLATSNPQSTRAAHELGVLYYEMADGSSDSPFFSFARNQFEREAQLPHASILGEQALILMAASAGQPVKDQWWEGLLGKLRERPVTPETTQAMFGLLQNRIKGAELNDDHLTAAFITMFSKATLPPYSYAQFGDYVLNQLGDEALADQVFSLAVERSLESPDYAAQIVRVLTEQGHTRQAGVARQRAEQLGLMGKGSTPFAPSAEGHGPAPGVPAPSLD